MIGFVGGAVVIAAAVLGLLADPNVIESVLLVLMGIFGAAIVLDQAIV